MAFILTPSLGYNHAPFGLRIRQAAGRPATKVFVTPDMRFQLFVDFDAFWAGLERDVATARQSILVQTFSFEGDRVGKMLAELLVRVRVPDKRVIVDSFSKVMVSDRFRYAPRNWLSADLQLEVQETRRLHATLVSEGVKIKYGNSFGFSPRKFLTRNHKKLIVVDDDIAYIGGINFSEHNASWHDMMLRIEDLETAKFLREDFHRCWQGQSASSIRRADGIEMRTLNGRANDAAFGEVLRLIDEAQSSIFVESPYITFPFYDHLRDARRRGVAVTIVTPRANNWGHFADYARWESARCGIDLRFFKNGMSHLKAMLIDDRHLIAGSSNFDFLSYRIYEELIAIITDAQLIQDFRQQVLDVDLRNSERAEEQISRTSSPWTRLRARVLNKGFTLLFD